MKNVFYFIKKALFVVKIFKFLYFCLQRFFPLSAIAFDIINYLNKNFITHFVWYLEKEIRCYIETFSIEIKQETFIWENHVENVHEKLAPDPFLI